MIGNDDKNMTWKLLFSGRAFWWLTKPRTATPAMYEIILATSNDGAQLVLLQLDSGTEKGPESADENHCEE